MAVSGLGGQTCQSQLTEANPPASICWWLFCSPAKHMLKRVVLQMTVGVCGVNQPKLMLAVLIWHKNPGQNQKPLQERNDYLNYQLISVSFSSTRPDITFSGNSLKLFFQQLVSEETAFIHFKDDLGVFIHEGLFVYLWKGWRAEWKCKIFFKTLDLRIIERESGAL